MEIKKRLFGQTKTGEAVFAFTLKQCGDRSHDPHIRRGSTVPEIRRNRCGVGL